MANVADLNIYDTRFIDTEIDSVVIRRKIATKTGGATLNIDKTEFDEKTITAGTLVIYNAATGVYKPLGVLNGTLQALPDGYSYYGIVIASTPADKPFVGVLINGVVNYKAMKYDISSILSPVKTALPHIQFIED